MSETKKCWLQAYPLMHEEGAVSGREVDLPSSEDAAQPALLHSVLSPCQALSLNDGCMAASVL